MCRGSCDGYFKHKRNNPTCDPLDSQGNEKMQFLFLFSIDILMRDEDIVSEERKTKSCLKLSCMWSE